MQMTGEHVVKEKLEGNVEKDSPYPCLTRFSPRALRDSVGVTLSSYSLMSWETAVDLNTRHCTVMHSSTLWPCRARNMIIKENPIAIQIRLRVLEGLPIRIIESRILSRAALCATFPLSATELPTISIVHLPKHGSKR